MRLFHGNRHNRPKTGEGGHEVICNKAEWDRTASDRRLWEWEHAISEDVLRTEEHKLKIPGYCDVCGSKVDFLLDDLCINPRFFENANDIHPS